MQPSDIALKYNEQIKQLGAHFKKEVVYKYNLNKDHSLHTFRHTAVTFLMSLGYNMYHISKIVGHSDVSTTTEMYSHLEVQHLMPAMNGLSEHISSIIGEDVVKQIVGG